MYKIKDQIQNNQNNPLLIKMRVKDNLFYLI